MFIIGAIIAACVWGWPAFIAVLLIGAICHILGFMMVLGDIEYAERKRKEQEAKWGQ
jgi:hypothetical protein